MKSVSGRPFFYAKLILMKKKITVDRIKELIRKNDTSQFYNSSEWKKLREYKRRLEHCECERCRARGKYSRGINVHHKKYLKDYPELALNIDNLECLCDECHYEEHHKREQLNEERW